VKTEGWNIVPLSQLRGQSHDSTLTTSLFSSPAWLDALSAEYGFEFSVLYHGDNVFEGLYFVSIDDLAGKRVISLPFSDYVLSSLAPPLLAQGLNYLRLQFPAHSIIYKSADMREFGKLLGSNWSSTRQAVYHRVSIDDEEIMWNRLSESFQRGVKKAKKSNVTVNHLLNEHSLEDFYKLYCALRLEKFHSIPQPFSFFKKILDRFSLDNSASILVASVEQKPVAVLFVLFYGEVAYYKFGASDGLYLNHRPNNLLFWELLCSLRERGVTELDLGLSGGGDSYAGLRKFKESMGGNERAIEYFTCRPESPNNNSAEEFKAHLSSLTTAIVNAKLDSEQVSSLSKLIYRYFA
ncbi:MAG: GNAT family N-acetyltransferase, partial [Bdellovibrionales bacterium]|nr:GNAT family N-acetyltransferase [Bdellovibrionales bacterium]